MQLVEYTVSCQYIGRLPIFHHCSNLCVKLLGRLHRLLDVLRWSPVEITFGFKQPVLGSTEFSNQNFVYFTLMIVCSLYHHYKLSHKREWNTENIALLRPISNKAEVLVGYGMQTRYIFRIHEEDTCDNVFIFKQTWRVTIEHTRRR